MVLKCVSIPKKAVYTIFFTFFAIIFTPFIAIEILICIKPILKILKFK